MNITVAICCYNSGKVLDRTLKTLRAATPNDLPVLVIDDGSTDDTASVAEKYGAQVIRHDVNQGYGWARQSALQHCETEFIAYIDDSCLVSANWYTYLVELWRKADSNTHAIVGKMEIFEPQTYLQNFMDRHNPFLPLPITFSRNNSIPKKLKAYLIGKVDIPACYISGFSNGNASFKKSSLDEIGGYDTRYRLGAEDEDIAARLQSRFGRNSIFYDPLLKVFHISSSSLKSLAVRNFRYGKSAAFRYRLEGGTPLILPIPAISAVIILTALILLNVTLLAIALLLIAFAYLPRTRKNFLSDASVIFLLEFMHLAGFCAQTLTKSPSRTERVLS